MNKNKNPLSWLVTIFSLCSLTEFLIWKHKPFPFYRTELIWPLLWVAHTFQFKDEQAWFDDAVTVVCLIQSLLSNMVSPVIELSPCVPGRQVAPAECLLPGFSKFSVHQYESFLKEGWWTAQPLMNVRSTRWKAQRPTQERRQEEHKSLETRAVTCALVGTTQPV